MAVHQLSAPFGSVRDLRAKRAIIFPAVAAVDVEIKVGIEERVQRAFDRRLAVRRAIIFVERAHPLGARHHRAPRKDRVEQLLLVLEIIVQQRVMHADALCDILQRDAMQPMFGKEKLGLVENLLDRLGPLFGLGRSPTRFHLLCHDIGFQSLFVRSGHHSFSPRHIRPASESYRFFRSAPAAWRRGAQRHPESTMAQRGL